MRSEFAPYTVGDREHRETWAKEGSKDTFARAHDAAVRILAEHKPMALDADVEKQVRERFPAIRDS